MSNKQDYEQKQKAQLAEWRAEIDKLKAKADQASADAKIEFNRQIKEFQEKQAAARVKLDELRGASEGAWENVKKGFDTAIHDVGEAFKAAAAKFRQ